MITGEDPRLMKTAQEWIDAKTHCVRKNVITDRFTQRDIAAIQVDALREAAAMLERLSNRIEREFGSHVKSPEVEMKISKQKKRNGLV
jgi:hypothetical protein